MSFLLGTNILSELRKGKDCNRNVADWFSAVRDDELFISVLTIGELRRGIDLNQRRDPKSGVLLNVWLQAVLNAFQDRLMPMDRNIAEEWGRMNVGRTLPAIDGLLAATATVLGTVLAARNTKDIANTGAAYLNPFLKL